MKSSAADRLACVDLPSLALQLLVRQHPDWRDSPVAVVSEDEPLGLVLQVNERARSQRVLPGLRYAAGLSLAPGLRAGVVTEDAVTAAVDGLAELLRTFSPSVEPSGDEPGVFWLDAAGLGHLWPQLYDWGEALADKLTADGWQATTALGFTVFGSYAVARAGGRRRLIVLGDRQAEQRLAMRVPLSRLKIADKARQGLERLGVRTVGELVALPADGVLRRFGGDAERIWRLAAGDRQPKLRPVAAIEPQKQVMHLDHGTVQASVLLFAVKRLLASLLQKMAARKEVVRTLTIGLWQEKTAGNSELLQPAEATLDEAMLLELVRLRLDSLQLKAEVVSVSVELQGAAATTEQLRMYFERPRRELRAADQALARLRAELGDDAVRCAQLRDGHLPHACFSWSPISHLPERAVLPRLAPADEPPRSLVRRLLDKPLLLPPQSRHVRDDGWLVHGLEHGSVVRSTGPYLVSGGWWRREVHREYQFAETQRGDLLWVYYDRLAQRWYQQGIVE